MHHITRLLVFCCVLVSAPKARNSGGISGSVSLFDWRIPRSVLTMAYHPWRQPLRLTRTPQLSVQDGSAGFGTV